jgi:malate dehydrogenase (quinone)
MLDVLQRCFPDKYESWLPTLKELIPTIGTTLNDRPAEADRVLKSTAETLKISV